MIIENYKWTNKQSNASLGKDKSVDEIINMILEERGIVTKKDKSLFLSPDFGKMHDPMGLPDMEKAVRRIQEAKKSNEKISIYGDYDVDGITSTSILYLFLKENGYTVDYYIPNRVDEGYGFNNEALKSIKDSGSSLLISVDTGISANEEVAYANQIGLDIIITDHHECQPILPEAVAIINPKRLDSTYPFQELAGVGVAFKLIHALAIQLGQVDHIWKYIDLVAVGTVADIVPLVDENRIIVKNAFDTILTTWNVGLDALLDVAQCRDKKMSAGTIGFQIGPRLNVAGRLGDAKQGVELFTTTDKEVASQIAKYLDEENKKRQAIEQEILEAAIQQIEKDENIHEKNVIVVGSKGWHNGVIGIVASRITERYYKPSIVISIEDGKATGSARSITGFSLFDALCNSSDYLEKFGGHDMAAGLSLDPDQIDDFRDHINEYAQVVLDEDILKRKIGIDYELSHEQINIPMAEALETLEPYGIGNPTPVFSYRAKVYDLRQIGAGKNHLKMQLYTADRLIDAIGFNMGYQNNIIGKNEEILIAGNLQKNEWMGKVSPQLVIRDIKSPEKESKKSRYYLSLYKRLPDPKIDEVKLFTNTIENCYISSYGSKISINTTKEYKDHIKYMIPTRNDAVALYRYVKGLSQAQVSEWSIHALKRDIEEDYMTEYKILQILDIFSQLGLLSYSYGDDSGMIKFNIVEGIKTDLSNSKRYRQLSQLSQKSF